MATATLVMIAVASFRPSSNRMIGILSKSGVVKMGALQGRIGVYWA